jgi:hypothetical protein
MRMSETKLRRDKQNKTEKKSVQTDTTCERKKEIEKERKKERKYRVVSD